MSNIDKQAVQAVADLKAGYTLGHADVAILNELARIALASLEAEAVAYIRDGFRADGVHFCGGIITAEEHERTKPALSDRYSWKHQPLYTAPPAPVSVPDELSREDYKRRFMEEDNFDDTFRGGWNACRAAMLQGAENAETPTTMQTAPALDSSPKIAESTSGNSPVIPDGYAEMLQRWLTFGRGMQKAGSQLPRNLIAETEAMIAAAPQQEEK
ncbi:hypothetical protein WCD91_10085 [Enterobacter cloacae]|uniref:hypothetical protein n=1 Tax=Enterobacter cloacae TaxID=550 RepID=UPI0034D51DF5